MIVSAVVQQHVDDVALLAGSRLAVVRAPYAGLDRLSEFDRRLAAHLEGVRLSGEEGLGLLDAALETPSPGLLFALAVRALEDHDEARLSRVFGLALALPETGSGLLAAFEWLEPRQLQGTVAALLRDADGYKRMVGLAACAAHRVDPGITSTGILHDSEPTVRARALQAASELGLTEALSACVAARDDADDVCQLWAAWSAVLLGDRGLGVKALTRRALSAGPHQALALLLTLQVVTTSAAHNLLRQLAGSPESARWLVLGSGIVGDPEYMPWLLKQMADLPLARLAGEAFANVTGVDLGEAALDRPAPEEFQSGPNDDPDDPNVDMDPDEGLPWPDVAKVEKWWAANSSRFQNGQRYFMGAPVTREHCIEVLKNAYQRQRIIAAHYLCLLNPGTPLFNTSAPAWRQQALLAKST